MKVTAIICEYNPFHKGHLSQLKTVKKNGNAVICVMSGGFVQRGEPALYNKFDRAKAAVLSGADLVLELPYPYCCSAAEFFCRGGVSLINSLNIADELCFGSECGNIDLLYRVSKRLMSVEFRNKLELERHNNAYKEIPFALLREQVYFHMYGESLPVTPNDILGIEYINSIKTLNSRIIPVTYKRSPGYSAAKARELIKNDCNFDMIPSDAAHIFENADKYSIYNAETAILSYFRTAKVSELNLCEGMTNGLGERLVKFSKESTGLQEFIDNSGGKSYTNARIRRSIIHGMTGVSPSMLKDAPLYTQVLASNETGRELIRRIQKNGSINILTKPAHYKKLEGSAKRQAKFNMTSDCLLTLMCDKPKEAAYNLKQTPFMLK